MIQYLLLQLKKTMIDTFYHFPSSKNSPTTALVSISFFPKIGKKDESFVPEILS